MSSPWESETQRTAWLKAQEGSRLLGAGDYEGAIANCTEAIELDARSLWAYRLRAEAYRHLGMARKAEADLRYLADLESQRNPETPSEVIFASRWGGKLLLGVILYALVASCLMLPGVGGIVASWVAGWSGQSILGGVSLLLGGIFLIFAIGSWRTMRGETPWVTGIITQKSIDLGDDEVGQTYYITVNTDQYFHRFRVPKNTYKVLSEGDRVTVPYYAITDFTVDRWVRKVVRYALSYASEPRES